MGAKIAQIFTQESEEVYERERKFGEILHGEQFYIKRKVGSSQTPGRQADGRKRTAGERGAGKATVTKGKGRYSIESDSRLDADYMAAVNKGDMETALRMVNERSAMLKAVVFAATDVPTYGTQKLDHLRNYRR